MKVINALSLSEICEAALDGEPVFLMRAQDLLTLDIVHEYLRQAEESKAKNLGRVHAAIEKISEWQKANPNKMKWPD